MKLVSQQIGEGTYNLICYQLEFTWDLELIRSMHVGNIWFHKHKGGIEIKYLIP